MTPKEKAIELRSQFGENAINECNKIIDRLNEIGTKGMFQIMLIHKFWQEVKQELDNLKK